MEYSQLYVVPSSTEIFIYGAAVVLLVGIGLVELMRICVFKHAEQKQHAA